MFSIIFLTSMSHGEIQCTLAPAPCGGVLCCFCTCTFRFDNFHHPRVFPLPYFVKSIQFIYTGGQPMSIVLQWEPSDSLNNDVVGGLK